MLEIDNKGLLDARKSARQLWWGGRDRLTSIHLINKDYTRVAGLFVLEIKTRSLVV